MVVVHERKVSQTLVGDADEVQAKESEDGSHSDSHTTEMGKLAPDFTSTLLACPPHDDLKNR